jgi:hypothetical protein
MAYITTVRARLRDPDPAQAKAHHNGIVSRLRPKGEPLGGSGHSVFANAADPHDFLAIDRWDSMAGMQQFMGDPSVQGEIGSLFESPPQVTVWEERDGWTAY